MTNNPREQGKSQPVGYKNPPVETRFGGSKANPRNNGAWKKEDTARYKLEQMMKLSSDELAAISSDTTAPLFERKLATCITNGEWKEIESMINQVYGQPKQSIEQVNITPPPPLSPRKRKGTIDKQESE